MGKWEVVAKYMDTERVNFPSGDCQVAIVHRSTAHPLVEEMLDQFVEVGSTTFDAEREEETEAKRRLEQEAAARHVKEKEERRKKAATELQQGSSDSMDEDVLATGCPSSFRRAARCQRKPNFRCRQAASVEQWSRSHQSSKSRVAPSHRCARSRARVAKMLRSSSQRRTVM